MHEIERTERVTVVGAGLVGSLLAMYLARRGFQTNGALRGLRWLNSKKKAPGGGPGPGDCTRRGGNARALWRS